eukprot:364003-Chlamydomonas_euryale.AAC.21
MQCRPGHPPGRRSCPGLCCPGPLTDHTTVVAVLAANAACFVQASLALAPQHVITRFTHPASRIVRVFSKGDR